MALLHLGWPRDRELVGGLLESAGAASMLTPASPELRRLLGAGRVDLVLADTKGGRGPLDDLIAVLGDVPEAGEVPMILLADAEEVAGLAELVLKRPNAVILSKPVDPGQLRTATLAGLRYRAGRRRERELVLRLSGVNAELMEMNAELDRRRAEAELAHLELREADRRKDEFLAMLAHELRNPIAAIAGAARVASASEDREEAGWAFDAITRQTRHLARLVDDLLDASRVAQGKIEFRPERVDGAVILRQAGESTRSFIEAREHTLEIDLAREPLWVDADPTRLEQMAVNLLTNAARYTPAGGIVRLGAERIGGQVLLRVTDNGIGIRPEDLGRMFELFVQGERNPARSEGGLGIGLSLVKALAEMHGGNVAASSSGPGLGSEFVVALPAAEEPDSRQAPTAVEPASSSRKSSRILVVDDSEDTARSLSRLLKSAGHAVRTAHDGPAALSVADLQRPEYVLLDLGLPGMDGYELAARIREQPWGGNAILVAISGYGQADDRRRSEAAGIDHHLVKPVDYDALFDLIHRQGRSK